VQLSIPSQARLPSSLPQPDTAAALCMLTAKRLLAAEGTHAALSIYQLRIRKISS